MHKQNQTAKLVGNVSSVDQVKNNIPQCKSVILMVYIWRLLHERALDTRW